MKVVILAAGIGSRLNETEGHLPKALTEFEDGRSILQYQLDALLRYFSVEDIFIVVGYQKESIIEKFPALHYIYNPCFAEENTSKSLLKALVDIQEDVLWLNGDVLFRHNILDQVIKKKQSCMVVSIGQVGAEEVKYRTNARGCISEVSKKVINGQGEAIGINFFRKEDLLILKETLETCQPTDYFEKGIEECIRQGIAVWPVFIQDDYIEIDFPEDLIKANQLLKSW